MASVTASAPTSSIFRAYIVHKSSVAVSASPLLGLPSMGKNKGGVRCSVEAKSQQRDNVSTVKMGASLATAVFSAAVSGPAMALVDERLSTEGTGLPFGLSNNLLVWILGGVFALIWSLYFVYTSSLEEDEESGLSL